jgi:transposase
VLRHLPGKLLIVWDGLRSHRSRLVWDFVREQHGRIWLESLPADAPELNPVEYSAKNLLLKIHCKSIAPLLLWCSNPDSEASGRRRKSVS